MPAYQDFLGIGGSGVTVYAPGEAPNPKNPGGVSDNKLAFDRRAAVTAANKARLAAEYEAARKVRVAKIVADQKAAAAAAAKRSGGLLGDLKAIGKGVGGAVGTALVVGGTVAQFVPGVGTAVGGAMLAGGAGLTALSKGDLKGAAAAGVTLAAPGLTAVAKSVAPVSAALETLKPVVQAAATVKAVVQSAPTLAQTMVVGQVVDKLIKGLPVDAAAVLPSIRSLAGDVTKNAAGLEVLVDKVLAARDRGGALAAQAEAILRTTQELANAGDATAKASLRVVASVTAQRQKAGVKPGVEQAATSLGASSLALALGASAGLHVAQSAVTVRSSQVTRLFADPKLPTLAKVGPPALAVVPVVQLKPQPKKVATAAASIAPQIEQGFVVTESARVLDGQSWIADETGSARGVLVRTTGPLALRRDATVRGWRHV